MSRDKRMVIAGGGQCGARTAHALRNNGWEGTITLIGEENALPYERPPLSKAVLLQQCDTAPCTVYGTAFYGEHDIDVITGASVDSLDRERHVGASGIGTTGEIAKEICLSQDLIAKQIRVSPAALMDRTVKLRSLLVAGVQ